MYPQADPAFGKFHTRQRHEGTIKIGFKTPNCSGEIAHEVNGTVNRLISGKTQNRCGDCLDSNFRSVKSASEIDPGQCGLIDAQKNVTTRKRPLTFASVRILRSLPASSPALNFSTA